MILIRVLLILVLVWLFLIAPNVLFSKRGLAAKLKGLYAHRGLHGNGVPENSLTAFSRAALKGFGIELDVHLTKDGQLVVMHDGDLNRMCGEKGLIEERTLEELSACRLDGTDESVPTLDQVLRLIDGRVPLIIEMKGETPNTKLAETLNARLEAYGGAYCVESFNPFLLSWYRHHRPDVARGQLSGDVRAEKGAPLSKKALFFALRNLLCDVLSRPDFIAWQFAQEGGLSVRVLRGLFRPVWAAWTVRSIKEQQTLQNRYDILIFEGYDPEEAHI